MAKSPESSGEKDTREKIIDAAEDVFSKKGFYGATVSEIFTAAGANRGLLSYYFSSKEKLFEATISRRMDDFRSRFMARMEGESPARIGDPIRNFCRSYIQFFLDMACDEDVGWRNYIRLLAQANTAYDLDEVHGNLQKFTFIIEYSSHHLMAIMPWAHRNNVERSLLYLETSVSTILTSGHLWSERLHDERQLDNPEFVENMAEFFSGAIKMHCA